MKISSSYPYPVIQEDNDDYEGSYFDVEFDVNESFGELKIYAKVQLDDPVVQGLIDEGRATFMVHVECPKTSYRQAFKFQDKYFDMSIPTKGLSGKVEIHSFIVAIDAIDHYQNNRLNEWFQDMPIKFEKGNFLAIGNAIEVMLNEDNTDLLNLPSIINIQRAKKNEYMTVDMTSNNIQIYLPSKEYDLYANHAKTMLKNTIISFVILPSLVQVFNDVATIGKEEFEHLVWYQVLDRIFEENNYDFSRVGTDSFPALQAAQMVLRKPVQASFNEIEKLSEVRD